MSLCEVHWKSTLLMKQVGMNVILPETGDPPFHTFYLLHGLSDNYTTWLRRTRIEWYVRNLPVIVVMPDGFRGFYTDNHAGPPYGRYMAEELVGFVERNFPARRDASARHIGGLSMGGYGAVRLALQYPQIFSSANSHSGAFLRAPIVPAPGAPSRFHNFPEEMLQVFGPHPEGSDHDVPALAKRRSAEGKLPRLYFDCGSEDYLIQANRDLHASLEQMSIPHIYREFPGAHEWDYWDLHISEAIAFHLAEVPTPMRT